MLVTKAKQQFLSTSEIKPPKDVPFKVHVLLIVSNFGCREISLHCLFSVTDVCLLFRCGDSWLSFQDLLANWERSPSGSWLSTVEVPGFLMCVCSGRRRRERSSSKMHVHIANFNNDSSEPFSSLQMTLICYFTCALYM